LKFKIILNLKVNFLLEVKYNCYLILQDLRSILQSSDKGRIVLQAYETEKKLNNKYRNYLAEAIINSELKNDLDKR